MDEDGLGFELRLSPEGIGRPDVPFVLEIEPGLEAAGDDGVTGASYFFDFQFKPIDETEEVIPFETGGWVIMAVLEEPVPTILTQVTDIQRGEGNTVALAGAEADSVDDLPQNTTDASILFVDDTDQGFVIFAHATLRLSPEGERFVETTPFTFTLSLGPIIVEVRDTRLTAKVTVDPETGHDRMDGTLSFGSILMDSGSGSPFEFPAGTTTFEARWNDPSVMPEGTPEVCGSLCGAATAQCNPPDDFPGEGFCEDDTPEEQ